MVTKANNDTADPAGSGHVFENVHADTGWWNNRRIMYANNNVANRNQGNDYSHSTYIDLVITGLVGVRPGVRGDQLVVNPMTLPGVKYVLLSITFEIGLSLLFFGSRSGSRARPRAQYSPARGGAVGLSLCRPHGCIADTSVSTA